MIKLNITKGEKDQSACIFVQEENKEKQPLTFETIKELSLRLLSSIIDNNDNGFDVSITDNSLLPYKETIEKVLQSIVDDKDLQDIYKEIKSNDTTSDDNNQSANQE